MTDDANLLITFAAASAATAARTEICEHKGIGHPDSICDGVAEAVCQALCRAYLHTYGAVQHHNVDKALLEAGQSAPRFSGGRIVVPMRLIVCGRATEVPGVQLVDLVRAAAREYIGQTLRCDPSLFSIEPAVREGSAGLRQIFSRGSVPLANDTSIGAGYAPYSVLERKVLELAEIMRSREFRDAFPAAGDDYKIMGVRVEQDLRFTIALAFLDREIGGVAGYFDLKAKVTRYLEEKASAPGAIGVNLLDDPGTSDESGIYLTVTGLSAEQGDDGQVGRGNRVNGLITPGRTMSLEATAGKNPIAHAGKLYNVLAHEMAAAICAQVEGIDEASVQILSMIGKPVTQPQLVSIEVVAAKAPDPHVTQRIEDVTRGWLGRVGEISQRLIEGKIRVF